MLPAYSLPEPRTIDSDQSRLVDIQRIKPAASRRSVIRFMGSSLFHSDLLTGHEPEIPLTLPSASTLLRRDKSGTLSPTGERPATSSVESDGVRGRPGSWKETTPPCQA